MWQWFALSVVAVVLTACASSPARPQRSEFEDIPVPAGLTLDLNKSTIIESPTVKAARLFYKGRVQPESLGTAFRTTLEANGWHHLSSTTSADKGITQVYDKAGNSLQVLIYEGFYYTWVEVSATKAVSATQQASETSAVPPAREPSTAPPQASTAPPQPSTVSPPTSSGPPPR